MDLNEIIDLAEAMANTHRGDYLGGEPTKALEDYNIPFIADDFGDEFEGLTRFHNGLFEVFHNINGTSSTTFGRQRFTIAHELAHVSLIKHRDAIRFGKGLHKSLLGFRSSQAMERGGRIRLILSGTDCSIVEAMQETPYVGSRQRARYRSEIWLFDYVCSTPLPIIAPWR